MKDLFSWSLDLGRWFGIRVRVLVLFLIFVGLHPLLAALSPRQAFLPALCTEALFLLSLLMHELGHAAAAYLTDTEPEEVLLGPFGNIILPPAVFRPQDSPWVPLGGIIASGVVAFLVAVGLSVNGAMMVFSPFGNPEDLGAPILLGMQTRTTAAPLSPAWVIGWFGWWNWCLFLLNLVPAVPLDGGRVVRAIVARSNLSPRDSLIVPVLARACAILLAAIGVFRLFQGRIDNFLFMVLLAFLVEWMVRLESRIYEEASEFETESFYDFSGGYTSLEAGTAKVRPYRENAIKRWRRRRSEARKARRQAQEAAEERRLDEILDKLHRLGKAALSDEENRFLVRVSSRIRGRSKS
jgi:Zn-dependent protease